MIYWIIILILTIAVSLLFGKLCLIRRQLRSISSQLQEQDVGLVSVEFIDRDLEAVALTINKKLELLQAVKAEAAKNEQALKTSISMVSHDMRTPLTSVIGYLQLAEKSCREAQTLQDIEIALGRAKYANKLVDAFFELSVVDSREYSPVMEKVNLCEVVCEEILANCIAFETKGITPLFQQAEGNIPVWADRKLLVRVIQNLISNGIKYSAGDMEFVITQDESIALSISNPVSVPVDTGKLFDKFYRADTSRTGEGAGLGLYICRKLVEEMHGKISADYQNGKVTITIILKAPGNELPGI